MSAFDRHPLRAEYEAAAKQFPPRLMGGVGGAKSWTVPISAQNVHVRYAVDLDRARKNVGIARETRQLQRQARRLGSAAFMAANPQQLGPDEV